MSLGVLLFLCGGRRVGLLRHFGRALEELGGGRIVTTETERYASTRFVADRTVFVSPCRDAERFTDDAAAICKAEAVTAIIPLTCAAVAAIPALRRCTDAFIISGNEEAIRICTDKYETAGHFRTAGLTTPTVIDCPTVSDLPLFCRPRFSEGSREAFAVRSLQELETVSSADNCVLTPYLRGDEFTIDCYKDLRGRLVATVPRERLRVRAGEVEQAVTRCIPELIEQTRAAVAGLDFVGPATVQAIRADGVNYFTEVNLRYGGGVTLSIAAGADSPRWMVAELHDGRPPKPVAIRWNFGMSRYDEE